MRTRLRGWFRGALGAGLALCGACASTDYPDLNLYSVDQDKAMGSRAYEELLAQSATLASGPEVETVERVTERLVASALELDHALAPRFDWQVTVLDAPDVVNAFCLPGGKMAVHSGMLPVAESDAGLAVVMAHEISHALLRHGTQRASRETAAAGLIAIFTDEPEEAQRAGVLGSLLLMMPWGRTEESEADLLGLRIMANAGYDPREAVRFWGRMAAGGGGAAGRLGEFFSTHPSERTRIADIRRALEEVLPLYEAARAAP
ncbi:MAG: M48 family metallopeptidase [Planctomycetota bacterium]|jgi:predicted Zn-dependent protease|nr:M48 family metallopeptidase [Planctomycetota bacterium]MDP6761806.1 M48 family metallopeptidase [Planctomycetota bacterium]MDP6988852.1 M48 family metallopeptidase [Planctomycetota bacterium]